MQAWPWICVFALMLAIYRFGTPPKHRGRRAKAQAPDAAMSLVLMALTLGLAVAAVLLPESRTGRRGGEMSADAAMFSAILFLALTMWSAANAARCWPRDPPDAKPLGLALGSGLCLVVAITALGLW